ncbi:MAG: hypothetical protein ACK5UQ_15740 [Planctomycetota bacterium]
MTAPLAFPPSLRWLARPPLVREQALAGHVTAVLFWRLGCDACEEAARELARLVEAPPPPGHAAGAGAGERPFAVVAVQVPTNAAERDDARQLRAASALPFAHAVDDERTFVAAAQVTALPYVLLLAADGEVVFRGAGVPQRVRFAGAVDTLLAAAEHAGLAALVPFVPLAPHAALRPSALLAEGDRLWLAAGHAVYELDVADRSQPRLVQRYGGDEPGTQDGRATAARFLRPAALCALPEHVLVADASAHTLRTIERHSGHVETWSGTGRLGLDRTGGAYARDQVLCTPVGLLPHDGAVVVAHTFAHQLWQFDPMTRAAAAWLGSGERVARHADELVFASPRSVAALGETLLVADAGANAIVAVDLAHQRGRVRWANVPRPTAVLVHGERVFVAASFAGDVRVASSAVADAPLLPFRGREHGLVEPVARAASGTPLWIADAGADAVFAVDLAQDDAPLLRMPWPIGSDDRAASERDAALVPAPLRQGAQLGPEQRIAAHADVRLVVRLPARHAADGVPWQIDVVDEGEPRLAVARHASVVARAGELTLLLPIDAPGRGALRVRLASAACVLRFVVPIEVLADGAARLEVGA